MGQFQELLMTHQLVRHNGQAIWKYGLSDTAFQQLRQVLFETKRLTDLDSRDCLLYYAEWWKRCYNGGTPSRKQVFNSFANGQHFNDEEFYKYARKGAELLGIKWIKQQKVYYFKTLLFQGGLPVLHMTSNKGYYKALLLKLLELNPTSIDDFAHDLAITGLLPAAGRNDEIYDCCLAIVTAIINEDQGYLKLLDTNSELRDITSELRIKKRSLNFEKKKAGFRSFWVMEPEEERIRLYLGLTDLSAEKFRSIFGLEADTTLDYEYKLYYNTTLLCRFSRRTDDSLRLKWLGEHELLWDGTDQLPELYLIGGAGSRHESQHLVTFLPRLDRPTLWTRYSENQWVLEKGAHTAAPEGLVLYPKGFEPIEDGESFALPLYGLGFQQRCFRGSLSLIKQNEQWQFQTDHRKIDWLIEDHRPAWLLRANYTVVRSRPSIVVYDDQESVVSKPILKWRPKNGGHWHDWQMVMTPGLLDIMIQVGPITEYDRLFHIGQLQLQATDRSLHEGVIAVTGNSFIFSINEGTLYTVTKLNSDQFRLTLRNNNAIPNAIAATLRSAAQNAGLRFELLPPFKGIEILDQQQRVIPDHTALSLHHLNGLRLMACQGKLRVQFRNSLRPKLVISEPLLESLIPLRTFADKMIQLFALSDTMNEEAVIKLEISEERAGGQLQQLREYQIKRYDLKLSWSFDADGIVWVSTGDTDVELLAIPLDCTNDELTLRPLILTDNSWRFNSEEKLDKFIVFSPDATCKVQPEFITRDPANVFTQPEDRQLRVLKHREELLGGTDDADCWQRLLSYYQICLLHELPYSTFDILRTASCSALLAAKIFMFLTVYDDKGEFAESGCSRMEEDIGFSFHWIAAEHWGEALMWIARGAGTQVESLLGAALKTYLEDQQPVGEFAKTSAYILQDSKPAIATGFHLRTRIMELRQSLGSRIISELPQRHPFIPEAYLDLIPVGEDAAKVALMLRAPLVAALSVGGKETELWHEDNEFKRRNIKYARQLAPEWYAELLNYCLTKI